MSESQDQSPDESPVGISDDLLPEDLQPGEDNPLADGLDDGETVDDLLDGGKDAEQLEDGSTEESSDESSDEEPDSADD
ncbi:hypothetical protein NSZ01_21630 [Nocardioides szechwanensis]|uniref:Uncharacterized protein n=1 Tax=Nocardioides szechwanensis TaxID=1005944 RepID=A0A1H0I4X5_9ACTN|nr:hypothetical protein [Nocardioides szechwanensis]GEP34395.1 hypothetical protein NSZ01_21630 [Nocardioides szechwanensis]SDO26466.1 hypothetical protein SAMN05192576_3685 [Nocardioides szechwanensis]